jgi:hypothetical protein
VVLREDNLDGAHDCRIPLTLAVPTAGDVLGSSFVNRGDLSIPRRRE